MLLVLYVVTNSSTPSLYYYIQLSPCFIGA
jgi:hypothetical protein